MTKIRGVGSYELVLGQFAPLQMSGRNHTTGKKLLRKVHIYILASGKGLIHILLIFVESIRFFTVLHCNNCGNIF